MEFWNNVIHTALLGTDKQQILPDNLPPPLSAIAMQLLQQPGSKEDHFLQIAAVAYNYRQAGITAKKEDVNMPKAADETVPYCNESARQILKDILTEESIPLLLLWLQTCTGHNQLLTPEFLPLVLETGVTNKLLRPLIIACGGQRAVWLSQFNAAWNYSSDAGNEELWQTGTPDQRKTVIHQLRRENPALALQWIQESWQQEDAATKTDLIKALATGLGENDIAFLESIAAEKSKKVKDEALLLLKKIPAAAIVQQYRHALQQMLRVKKEKALLGMVNKTSLHVLALPNADDYIYKTGIEKLSNTKELTDDENIVYQILRFTPLSYLEESWQLKPEDIIQLFQKDNTGKKLLPALVLSAVNFNDTRWAISLMHHSSVFYTDIIPLLPLQQQDFYSIKFFKEQPVQIIQYAVQRETEWSRELATLICRHAAASPYQYNRSFFSQHIRLLPSAIAPELEKYTPHEDHLQTMWSNTSDYLLKLLSLKAQTINAFN